MTPEKVALFVKTYEEKGKLPEKKIPCVKCGEAVSMFNDNLKHRIAKFGSVFNLLTQFECRTCRKTEKVAKATKKISKKKEKVVNEEIKKGQLNVKKNKTLESLFNAILK